MNYFRLIRSNPDFAKLWGAQVISLLGDWFNTIVLSALIVTYTEGTSYQGFAVSAFLLTRLIPPLLMRPIAGVIADRFNRKRLLIISDLLRSVSVIGLIFVTRDPQLLPLIYVLTTIQFLLSSVFEPARNALMPSLLYRDQLVTGNTLSSVTWSVMLAVGAIVGGVVAEQFGTQVALVFDASTFVMSALLVISIKVPAIPRSEIGLADNRVKIEPSQRTFRQGLRFLAQNPAIAAVTLIKAGLSMGSVDVVLIIYGTQLFARGTNGTTSMAILWCAFGLGSIIGPIITNYFSDETVRSLRRLLVLGFIWVTLGWLFFGLAPSLELAALALILRAMGGSVNWTYSSVILQKVVPDEYLGRMFSLDFAFFELVQGIATITMGLLIDAIGNHNVQWIVIGTAFISLLPLVMWIWAIQRLDRREAQLAIATGD